MAMNDDFCSYELSKALKACGFDEPCAAFYEHINGKMYFSVDGNEDWNGGVDYSAPHIYHAQKWLREEKNIIVDVSPGWDSEDYCLSDYLTGEWYFSVWKDGDRVHCNFDPNAEEERIWIFEKYEQALSAGIAAALELIEQENK